MPVVVFAVGSNDLLGEAVAAQWSNFTVGLHKVAANGGSCLRPCRQAPISPLSGRGPDPLNHRVCTRWELDCCASMWSPAA